MRDIYITRRTAFECEEKVAWRVASCFANLVVFACLYTQALDTRVQLLVLVQVLELYVVWLWCFVSAECSVFCNIALLSSVLVYVEPAQPLILQCTAVLGDYLYHISLVSLLYLLCNGHEIMSVCSHAQGHLPASP